MRLAHFALLTALPLATFGSTPCPGADDERFLIKADPPGAVPMHLTHPIKLEERQAGIEATAVNRWVIEPNGEFKVFKFRLQDGEAAPEAEAGLTPAATGTIGEAGVKELAHLLEAHHVTKLPQSLGRDRKVNNHSYHLKFGPVQTRVCGAPTRRGPDVRANVIKSMQVAPADSGGTTNEEDSKAEPWRGFASIAGFIVSRTDAKP